MNPLKSRSTIISVVCILAFLGFAAMVLSAGYFDAGFGGAGIIFLSTVIKYALDHQAKEGVDHETPPKLEEESKTK
jgi:hypothetical protein